MVSHPPLRHNVYALPSPINMTTMIRQNAKFPPTARSPIIKTLKKTNLTQPLKLLNHYLPPLHDLIVSPHVKHPPKKFAPKILFLHTKLFYEKGSPIRCRGGGGRRHYALFSNLVPFLKVYP